MFVKAECASLEGCTLRAIVCTDEPRGAPWGPRRPGSAGLHGPADLIRVLAPLQDHGEEDDRPHGGDQCLEELEHVLRRMRDVAERVDLARC